MDLYKLRKEHRKTADALAATYEAALNEDRVLTEDEQAKVDELKGELDVLNKKIAQAEDLEELKKTMPAKDVTEDSAQKAVRQASISVRDCREDDPAKGFSCMGDFGAAVMRAGNPTVRNLDDRLSILGAGDGLNQSSGADGGFLVPPEFSRQIWDGIMNEQLNLLSMCDTYTVQGESLTFPAGAETSRADGSRAGGIQGYWKSESVQMSETNPTFREVKVEPQELYVFVAATDKLLNNTVALDRYINRKATEEINFKIGDAIINGDGVGKPKGILTSGATVSVAEETSQAADTVVAANINKMWARLDPRSRGNAVWLVNPDVEPQFDGVNIVTTDVEGTTTAGGYNAQIYNAQNNTLKGRPIIPCEWCQTIGDAGDIILADMKGYLAGVKGGVQSDISIHLRFDYNETVFRFILRADGQTWLQSAITPFNGSNTVSHFVKLDAR